MWRKLGLLLFAVVVSCAWREYVSAQIPIPVQDPFGAQEEKEVPIAPAAKKAEPATPKASINATKATDGKLHFLAKLQDDSQIKIELLDKQLTMKTKYGSLAIPVQEIKRIEMGMRIEPTTEAKIMTVIKEFGSETYATREAAEKKIVEFQELALPALRDAMKTGDREVIVRAKRIVEQLQSSLPEEKFNRKSNDLIETTEFTVTGKIEINEFAIQSRVFGNAKLLLSELRQLRAITSNLVDELTVDSSQYGRPNRQAWFDTGFDVTTDQALQIEASGMIELYPQQPGQMMCGPTGWPNNNMTVVNPNGSRISVSNGALVGRIGNNGNTFLVGARYQTNRPNEAGRLYLQVMPSPNGNDPQGSYKVKINPLR
jgi:hypothetical protein